MLLNTTGNITYPIRKVIDPLFNKKGKQTLESPFKPARRLYTVLLAISIPSAIFCILIPQDSPWFTIATGIFCGGVASTIIAWLIDEANSNAARKKTKINQEILFHNLYSVFDHGLQILIFNLENYLQSSDPRKWFEWVECAKELSMEHLDFQKEYRYSMAVFTKDLEEAVSGVVSQSTIMLSYGIIDERDIEALSTIRIVCGIIRNELFSDEKGPESVIETVNMNCKLIKKLLDYSPALKPINEQLVDPKLSVLKRSS